MSGWPTPSPGSASARGTSWAAGWASGPRRRCGIWRPFAWAPCRCRCLRSSGWMPLPIASTTVGQRRCCFAVTTPGGSWRYARSWTPSRRWWTRTGSRPGPPPSPRCWRRAPQDSRRRDCLWSTRPCSSTPPAPPACPRGPCMPSAASRPASPGWNWRTTAFRSPATAFGARRIGPGSAACSTPCWRRGATASRWWPWSAAGSTRSRCWAPSPRSGCAMPFCPRPRSSCCGRCRTSGGASTCTCAPCIAAGRACRRTFSPGGPRSSAAWRKSTA